MTDTEYIVDMIKNSGITKTHICNMLKISRTTLESRLSGSSEFTLKELNGLCKVLRLTDEEKEKFLAPMFK